MHIDKLLRMANQIGDYFESMPDKAEARDGIALHIKKFWEPRMRRELLAHIDRTGGAELHPDVLQAIQGHREALTPAPA